MGVDCPKMPKKKYDDIIMVVLQTEYQSMSDGPYRC